MDSEIGLKKENEKKIAAAYQSWSGKRIWYSMHTSHFIHPPISLAQIGSAMGTEIFTTDLI